MDGKFYIGRKRMNNNHKHISVLTAVIMGISMLFPLHVQAADDLGDVNGDGQVNAKDAVEILIDAARRSTKQLTLFTAEQEALADVNGDNSINAADATEILVYAAKKGTGEIQTGFREYMQEKQVYKPKYDTCKAYWLDMSKMEDFTFNGEFLTVTFQLKENIPDGHYPVKISKTDIASWEEVCYYPMIIDGEIAVGCEAAEQNAMPDRDFTLKVNSMSAKQGDIVTLTIDLANNPGFCGFVIDIQYDTNAMTIVEAKGGEDYNEAVTLSQ
jgi:hypothetical protein